MKKLLPSALFCLLVACGAQEVQAAPKATVWVGTDAKLVGNGSDSVSQLSVDLPSALRKALIKKGYQVVLTQDQPHDLEVRLRVDTDTTYAVLDAWVNFRKATLFLEQEGRELTQVEFLSDEHGGHFKSYGEPGERYAVLAAQKLVEQLDGTPAMAQFAQQRTQPAPPVAPPATATAALTPAVAATAPVTPPAALATLLPATGKAAGGESPGLTLPDLRNDTFAVVIGIDYQGRSDIPSLQFASQDAGKVFDVLTDPRYGGVPKENAILLQNEKATKNAVLSSLRKIKSREGYVYVYYSGHGAPKTVESKVVDTLLVPYDVDVTDPEALEESSIKISYLQELLNSSKAKGVMVALDACFSGGGKSVTAKGAKPLVAMLPTAELFQPKGDGRIILTSSAGNQQSWEEANELRGGIFSHYFIDGLKGKGGGDLWVKVRELANYVEQNVQSAALKLKGVEQTPQISGSGDFVITRNWERMKVADADIARSRLKSAFERGRISASQIGRALRELESGARSKVLESFLQGALEEDDFAKLY